MMSAGNGTARSSKMKTFEQQGGQHNSRRRVARELFLFQRVGASARADVFKVEEGGRTTDSPL
jgi:hypothetical protein